MSIPYSSAGNASFELPVEIVQEIFKQLPRRDLKSIRLSSKALAEQATCLVFNAVFLSPDPIDIEKTASVFAAFKSSIRTLIFSPIFFDKISMAGYRKCVQQGADYKSYLGTLLHHLRFPYRSRFTEHIKMGYEDLKSRSWAEGTPMNRLLRRILQHAPNLRRLVITDRRRAMDLTGCELAKFCCWEDCSIAPEMHAMFRLTPAQAKEHGRPDCLTDCYNSIFTNGSRLRDLTIEQAKIEYDGYRLTTRDIFGLVSFDPHARAFMATLTTLKLDVDAEPYPYDPLTGFLLRELAGYLGHAQNVEVLALRVVNWDDYEDDEDDDDDDTPVACPSEFDRILRDCHFPRLRNFRLSDCSMTYDELLSFLKTSPNIKTLSLESCVLETHCWMDVIEYIKASSRIKNLSLYQIKGCFGLNDESGPELYYGDDVIEDFLLGNGPNPLDSEALKAFTEHSRIGLSKDKETPSISH